MNLLTKVVIVLVAINKIESGSMRNESHCDVSKAQVHNQCLTTAFGVPEHAVRRLIAFPNNSEQNCCFQWYGLCAGSKFAMKSCKPTDKYPGLVKGSLQQILKDCSKNIPSKDKCVKYQKPMDQNKCKDSIHSVCDNYNEQTIDMEMAWSSFTSISVNVLVICLLLFISILIVF